MKIFSCDFEITQRCNLNCTYCVYRGNLNKKELAIKDITSILNQLKEYGCEEIRFTGGEPFLREDFLEILRICKKLGISTRVITNGTLLSKRLVRKLANLISGIGISLDSHREKINEKTRKGSFKRAMNVINWCRSLSIPVSVYITLTSFNESSIFESLRYFYSLGVNFHITTVIPRGRALSAKEVLLSRTSRYYIKLFKTFLKDLLNERIKLKNNCEATFLEPFISSDGKIYCCVEIYHILPRFHILDIFSSQKILDWEKKISRVREKLKCCYTVLFSRGCSVCVRTLDTCSLYEVIKYV